LKKLLLQYQILELSLLHGPFHVVALALPDDVEIAAVVDNVRGEKNEQIGLDVFLGLKLEEPPDQGDIPQERDLPVRNADDKGVGSPR